MATGNDLFDEPEKSDKPAGRQASEKRPASEGEGRHGGVSRRRFLVGAGTAAVAGAAVGSGVTAGINAFGDDSESGTTSPAGGKTA